ncbi:hypothetical protein [Pseudonocardia lacus]|uniref:hypothetical protein n=1 Tax=Pseudonocardia lacus TaxID=2835865 RepID=UPI0020284E47|nr:hypothetical protein [Pseudonocardia lacus]
MRIDDTGTDAGPRKTMVVALAAALAALLAAGAALFVFGLGTQAVPGTGTSTAASTADDPDEGGEVAMLAFPNRPAPPGFDDDGGATDGGYNEPEPPAELPPDTSARTLNDLKNDGWTCTKQALSGGTWVCTKPGQKDFYCSSESSCDQLLRGRHGNEIDLSGSSNAPVTHGPTGGGGVTTGSGTHATP